MFDLVPFGKRREESWGQLMKSFNDVFNDEFFAPLKSSTLSFKTDIRETDHAYLVEAELPGFTKENIDIDYAAPYLTIKAVHHAETSAEDESKGQVVRKERRHGEYVRRFYVEDIDADHIQASLKDGLLKLDIPKRQRPEGRRIEIQSGE
ncbi:Hsp20/alpha crystallin family protein [Paenibacillus dauci]|uniref:Hsp20/alpha crystallin family protein n=1 Tax=Paenibacillus dauci TaxID=1567106 RepID=UPI0006192DC9|nr:Hsp20/alpha crystallin family protein [Paenibacillus dauci]